jgi:hypothetical protein
MKLYSYKHKITSNTHTKYITYPSQHEAVRLIYTTEVTSKQAQKNKGIIKTPGIRQSLALAVPAMPVRLGP